MNWVHKQEKDNLSNLIKDSLEKKWMYKFKMREWFKKAEHIPTMATMATVKNNIIWIKKYDKLLLYVPSALRQRLLFVAHGDLLIGNNGVKNTKKDC
jgi:hypothetical protein